MSGRLVGAVLQDRLDDAPARQRQGLRAVLVVLAEASRDGSVAWPSIATIAERSLISPRQVSRLLTQLEQLGRIRPSGSRSGGRAKATRWHVLPRPAEAVNHDTTPPNGDVETMTSRTGNHDTQMSSEPYEPFPPLPPAERGAEGSQGEGPTSAPALPGLGRGEEGLPAIGRGSRAAGTNRRAVERRRLQEAERAAKAERDQRIEATRLQAELEEAERERTRPERLAAARAALERVRAIPPARAAAEGRR